MQIISHKLTSADGEYYTLSLTQPTGDSKQPLILCLPAMGIPARMYLPLAESLNSSGMASALFELRGIGSSSVRASSRSNFGYHEILNLDLPEALHFIRRHYPENPIYLLGHSLGGQLALLYMSVNPQEIQGLIGIATGVPSFKSWRFPYNLGILAMAKVMPLIASGIGHFPGKKFGFGGRESRQLLKDWSYSVTTGNYRAAGSQHDFESKIKQLSKQALLISIEQDILAPQAPLKVLGEKMAQSEVTYHHLQAGDFENDSLGHFNWMKEPAPITTKIKNWLKL